MELLVRVHVAAGEGHVVERLVVGLVFPDRRFDAAETEGLHGEGGGGLGFRSSGSGFRIHDFPFGCEERDCSLAPRRRRRSE